MQDIRGFKKGNLLRLKHGFYLHRYLDLKTEQEMLETLCGQVEAFAELAGRAQTLAERVRYIQMMGVSARKIGQIIR